MALETFTPPSLNITNCVTIKLTERNYMLWKSQFETFLSGQGLLGFINGASATPLPMLPVPAIDGTLTETTNPDYQSWVRTDQVVKSWLLGSFSEDILSVVVECPTSKDVWLVLANHFNRVSSSRLFELQRNLQTVTKHDKTMAVYLKEIKDICDQLSSIGSPVFEKMKIFAALHGLGREYEPIKTSIEGLMDSVPCPSFEQIVPRLMNFDNRLQGYEAGSTVSPHLAFNVISSNNKGFYEVVNIGRGGNRRAGGNRGRGSFSTRGRGFHQQISSSSGSQSAYSGDNRPMCQICGKMGHPALKCWYRFDNSYQSEDSPVAMAALQISEVSEQDGNEWYPDSGATAHITNTTQRLTQAQPYYGTDTVFIGDGNFLPITHVGSANLASSSGQGNKEAPDKGKKT